MVLTVPELTPEGLRDEEGNAGSQVPGHLGRRVLQHVGQSPKSCG